jgi:hypothetical protein
MSHFDESIGARGKFPDTTGRGAAYGAELASNLAVNGLDPPRAYGEDGIQGAMRISRNFSRFLSLGVVLVAAQCVLAQDPPPPAPSEKIPPVKTDVLSRITIEVTGGEKDTPVENASVYVKYVEEHKLWKDKKLELNVKTNRDGVARVPNAPLGRVLIQVIAEGWKTYGRWYDVTDTKQVFKIRLQRPPKWY